MSSNYSKLIENIDKLETEISSISSNIFSIEKYVLPTEEVIKNIIKIENPYIPSSDIELMVNGFGKKEDIDDIRNGVIVSKSETLNKIIDLENQVDSESKSILVSNIVDESLINNVYPLNDINDTYYQKAESIKKQIIDSFNIFQQKSKDLVMETNMASLMIVNSIPGALISGTVAPFTPNIPGAISVVSTVMVTLTQLKSKFISLISELVNLKKINIIISPKNLNKIAGFLNKLISVLVGPILKVLKLISGFIKKAIESLLKHSDSKKEEKRARKIARQLRNYKYLPNNNIKSVDEDDVDDVELILEEWEVVDVGAKKPGRLGKVKRKNSIEDAVKILTDSLYSVDDFTDLVSDIEQESDILYDVEFTNGEIAFGLTLDEVNSLGQKYEIIFSSEKNKPN